KRDWSSDVCSSDLNSSPQFFVSSSNCLSFSLSSINVCNGAPLASSKTRPIFLFLLYKFASNPKPSIPVNVLIAFNSYPLIFAIMYLPFFYLIYKIHHIYFIVNHLC